ncbi:MAG: hypothetical protein H0U54_08535 [Acidobacteria bacterium]|jgi:hypothetical protein|nr:hypothetical protein [Acidobacteriota bacterium]
MENKEKQAKQKDESVQGHCHTVPAKEKVQPVTEKTVKSGCCGGGK